ncbi:hypothetical protein [uncultured Oscillibacter sp.]|uniref:hypothetical protein n=1 Tax=uncultured Oscillibacter sp. TaxID=876091 RepID=UPI00272E12B1|nr:hypothetical protein [uncultured Oscillibacter sp.]
MDNAAKSAKKVGYFSEMEDVSGKKILDFSGRIVHNGFYPTRRSGQMCCKTHLLAAKTGEKNGRWGEFCLQAGPAA